MVTVAESLLVCCAPWEGANPQQSTELCDRFGDLSVSISMLGSAPHPGSAQPQWLEMLLG